MTSRFRQSAGFLAASAMISATCAAQDNWPQWRGPELNGVSRAHHLATTWTASENVVWKTELPHWSGATPIIWGDHIFIMSPAAPPPVAEAPPQEEAASAGEQQEGGRRRGGFRSRGGGRNPGGDDILLLCISRTNGEVLWTRKIDEGNQLHMKSNNASNSPVTDGKHVWVVTGNGSVAALDMEGNFVWQTNLQKSYGQFGLNWGYGSSPLLFEGLVIIEVLHGHRTDDPSYVVAFDAESGEVAWRVERPTDAPSESPDAYTTPVVLDIGGKKQIVISGGDYVTGHDPVTGKELWRTGGLNPRGAGNFRIVASPVAVGGMVYAPSRERPLLALGATVDSEDPQVVWQWNQAGAPDVPTPVSDGRRFYMVNDAGIVTCLDAKSGEVIWGPERTVSGTVSGSPIVADGKIYFTNEDAMTVVLEAADQFKLIAVNELDGSYTLSTPTAVGDELFIRTGTHLYCIKAPTPE